MIEEHAVILNTENDNQNTPLATIEVIRKSACGLCGQTRGCGNAIWGKLFAHNTTSFKAQNVINAKVGQNVIVGIDESAVMKSALLLYIVPLVTMLIVTILVSQVYDTYLPQILGSIFGLILGFFWVKGHTTGHAFYENHRPKILRLDVVGSEEKLIKFQ